MYIIISSINSDSFTSVAIWIPFLSFSSLIAMGRTSKTILNTGGESGHACLVYDLRGNTLSFLWFSVMSFLLCWCALCAYPLERFLFVFFFFTHKWVLNFVKGFFCVYWDDYVVFILQFVNMVYHTDWFVGIEKSFCPWG